MILPFFRKPDNVPGLLVGFRCKWLLSGCDIVPGLRDFCNLWILGMLALDFCKHLSYIIYNIWKRRGRNTRIVTHIYDYLENPGPVMNEQQKSRIW